MELGITIPLQKHLKIKELNYGGITDLFFCWELHIIRFEKKNLLIVVNASNRFCCIMAGMMAKDWKIIAQRAEEAIRMGFAREGYTEEQIDQYFAMAGAFVMTKTHGRRPVAGLNRAIEGLYYVPTPAEEQLYQNFWNHEVNLDLCHAAGVTGCGYDNPWSFLKRDMQRVGIL